LCTRFTANAAAAVKINYPVFARKECGYRADLNAGSISAVVASHYRKQPARVGKGALFDVLDPSAIYADRHLVFGLTGDSARMAADAFTVVDNEAEIHRRAK
jgi:hypothetical protein